MTPYDRGQPCAPVMAPRTANPTIYHPNPFSVNAIPTEWCSNDLILRDVNLRRLARVRPLDCGIRDLYIINPLPPKI